MSRSITTKSAMYKAGEYLFYRRGGQTDFGCVQCHGEAGKRIRLQDLNT